MNNVDFTNLGGFPLEQDTLEFVQNANADLFSGLARFFGNKCILSGVEVVGGAVTDGWITYNGEIIKFIGANAGDTVVVIEQTGDATFEDQTVRGVYKTRTATIGSVGTTQFSFADLVRVDDMITQVAAFAALLNAFNAHNHNYNNLNGLPGWKIVHRGQQNIGDLPSTDSTFTVAIPDQGGTDYHVYVTVWVNNNNYVQNNDISFVLYDKQATSFKIGFREYENHSQNLRVEFIIVKAQ